MAKFIGNPDFKHGTKLKIGILLSNLGTPDKPQRKELRVYLKEFLSDPRVIESMKKSLTSSPMNIRTFRALNLLNKVLNILILRIRLATLKKSASRAVDR